MSRDATSISKRVAEMPYTPYTHVWHFLILFNECYYYVRKGRLSKLIYDFMNAIITGNTFPKVINLHTQAIISIPIYPIRSRQLSH